MPIISVTSDPQSLSLSVIGDYPVSIDRLWDAYSDPRQLERFWGPENWPAKFTRHDFTVGGHSHYTMTGPDGAQSSGWWHILAIERPYLIEIEDGFASPDGSPDTNMPTMRITFTFEPTSTGARFEGVTQFQNLESMEQLLKMGMVEGMHSAMGQRDSVLVSKRRLSPHSAFSTG